MSSRLQPSNPVDPSFPCPNPNCKGRARPIAMDGRFYFHRQIWINVPEKFLIPRCDICKQDWFTPELDQATNELLEVEYMRHAEMIAGIVQKFHQAT
jgi:hypothetical protein